MADMRENPLNQTLVEAEDALINAATCRVSVDVLPSAGSKEHTATVHVRFTDMSSLATADSASARRLLVLALDTSGSMRSNAASVEGTELSRLQLAQICVNLSLQALGPQDDIAIVSFSSKPTLALDITPMTESGRAEAIKVENGLKAFGSTDIKGALLMAMDVCKRADAGASADTMVDALKKQMTGQGAGSGASRQTSALARAIARRAAALTGSGDPAAAGDDDNGDPGAPAGEPSTAEAASVPTPANSALAALIAATSSSKARYDVVRIGLFTDGYPEPNISPDAKGELLRLLADAEKQNAVLSTFGFGNEIARDLLVQLAQAGGGTFAHISDSSMALTTFVNFISSFKSTSSAGRVRLSFHGHPLSDPSDAGGELVPSKASASTSVSSSEDDERCFVKVKRVYGAQASTASASGPASNSTAAASDSGRGFVGNRSVHIDLGSVQKGDDQPRSVVLEVALNPALLAAGVSNDSPAMTITADAFGCGGRNNKPSKAVLTITAAQILDAARGAKRTTVATVTGDDSAAPAGPVVEQTTITSFSQLYDTDAEVARLRGHYVDSLRAIAKQAAGLLARGGGKGDDVLEPCRDQINQLMKELEEPFPQAVVAPELAREVGATAAEDARRDASASVAADNRVASLRQNIYDDDEPERGQVGLAFKRTAWLESWGLSYLQSFLLAHSRALCTNFKDVSVQSYASKAFNQEKEGLEASLSSLLVELVSDAIKQSQLEARMMGSVYDRGVIPAGAQAYGTPVALSAASVTSLYDCRGGCFSGDSTVTKTDDAGGNKETVALSELKAGMTVMGFDVRYGAQCPVRVRAVLLRKGVAGVTSTFMDTYPGLKLTPWHPYAFITLAATHPLQWAFPHDMPAGARQIEVEGADLYNVVLEEPETCISVGGAMCASLGHGITPALLEDAERHEKFLLKALAHPYYGDRERVLADVERLEAAQPNHTEKGQLVITGEVRDPETNLVAGIV